VNGACCGKTGICGYSPDECGSGNCLSNCDAKVCHVAPWLLLRCLSAAYLPNSLSLGRVWPVCSFGQRNLSAKRLLFKIWLLWNY
jgi:hypothetical protein